MLIELTEAQRDALLVLVDSRLTAADKAASHKNIRIYEGLRQALVTPFTPKAFIGLYGGLVQGMTTNCAIDYLVADQDTEDADESEIVHLPTWECDAVIGGPGSVVDAVECEALFAEALKEESDDDANPA